MPAFLSIAILTCRATLRSYVFYALFLILLAVVFIVPNTIAGDGTSHGLIKISLKYCLGISGFILSISTIWVSCFVLSNDLETYQMHMICVKPVSRIVIWLGKFSGVVFLHGVLLFISSIIIFFFLSWQFNKSEFSEKEKKKAKTEVFAGRRVYMPESPDFSAQVRKKFRELLKAVDTGELGVPEKLDKEQKKQYLKEIHKQIVAQYGEIKPGNVKSWTFRGLNPRQTDPLFLRYRVYVGKVSSKDQRETMGLWSVSAPMYEDQEAQAKRDKSKAKYEMLPKLPYPEPIMCNVFMEERLHPDVIDKDGKVTISFLNADPGNAPLFFQPGDGPKLMEKRTSFFQNYCRAVLMIFFRLVLLSGLGASAGGLLSMPVAVFFVISYLVFGIAATFVVSIEKSFDFDIEALEQSEAFHETASRYASHALLAVIIPIQKFEVSDTIAEGELIELSFIRRFIMDVFLLRGLPVFALAIFLYKRREIGLIIRK